MDLDIELQKIFVLNSKGYIKSRESSTNEFKASFNWGSKADYAKTISAFANNKWWFIIFWVNPSPKEPIWLKNSNFEDRDPAEVLQYLSSVFYWEIVFETWVYEFNSKDFWYIRVLEGAKKPIICSKNDGKEWALKSWDIYYRDWARSIRMSGDILSQIMENEREKEKKLWMNLSERISKIGVQNAGLLNLNSWEISWNGWSIIIDESLLSKLQFIKEWSFSEKDWAPTLKLIWELTSSAQVVEKEVDINEIFKYWTKEVGKEVWFAEKNATSNALALIKHYSLNTEKYMREFKLYAKSNPTKKYSIDAINFLKNKLSEGDFSLNVNSEKLRNIRKNLNN